MLKKIVYIFLFFITIFCFICSLLFIKNVQNSIQKDIPPSQQVRRLYKTIPVTVTDIKMTWAYKGTFKWDIIYSSEEYGVKNIQSVSNWDTYGNDIQRGNLKVGSQLEATLWSVVQGNEIVSRSLSNLK